MADPLDFLVYPRREPPVRDPIERIGDNASFGNILDTEELSKQASRCMECGIPFCQTHGCPLKNRIPDWIAMVRARKWRTALDMLHDTINFPEFTGRICPAPCESACTLSLTVEPVIIRYIELQIVEHGWDEGWIIPMRAGIRSGKRVAVIGSGPAGMTVAQDCARQGHDVVIFERDDRPGGVMRYGIPEFALGNNIIDRRIEQLLQEGVTIETRVDVGTDISGRYLNRSFDAIVIATGIAAYTVKQPSGFGTIPVIDGYDLLRRYNRMSDKDNDFELLSPREKNVVIVGNSMLSDYCIGVAARSGASSIHYISSPDNTAEQRWPDSSTNMKMTLCHEGKCVIHENCRVSDVTKDDETYTIELHHMLSSHDESGGKTSGNETQKHITADMIVSTEITEKSDAAPLLHDLCLKIESGELVAFDNPHQQSAGNVFACGDCMTGLSSVVNAMTGARRTAAIVNHYLKGC